MAELDTGAKRVLDFWFAEHTGEDWFGGRQAFDVAVRIAFAATLDRAQRSELWEWRSTPRGRVAEIIVLDQFARQLHRGSARAFASDTMALALAQELVALGGMEGLSADERIFALMPYMHSESLAVHEVAIPLFERWTDENTLEYERKHFDVISRFGRYPMRNAALGRASTPAERAYIEERAGNMF